MAGTNVYIDISDDHIAAVVLEGSGSRVKVVRCVHAACPVEKAPEDVAEAVHDLLERNGIPLGECHLLIDSAEGVFRNYFFPFSKLGQVESSLLYELGEDLPVPLDTMLYDTVLTKIGKKFSRVCAVAYSRQYLIELVNAFESVGIVPAVIEPEVCGLARAAFAGAKSPMEHSVLVDVGRERTVVAALKGDSVISIQVIIQGISTILGELQGKHSAADIEKVLAFADFSSKSSVPEKLQPFFLPVQNLVDRVVMAAGRFEEQSGSWDGPVVVCGEMASIKGLTELFAERMEREAFSILETSQATAFLGVEDLLDTNRVMGAWGAGRKGTSAEKSCNLRKDFLKLQGARSHWGKRFRYQLGLLCFCLFMGGSMFVANVQQQGAILTEYQQAGTELFYSTLPEVAKGMSSGQRISILKARIDRMQGVGKSDNSPTLRAIDELRLINTSVGTAVDVVFDKLRRDVRKTAVSGMAGAYKDVETLRNVLSQTQKYSTVVIKGAAVDKKSGRIRFELELVRK